MKNFLLFFLKYGSRRYFPVLWQFLKNAASPAGEPPQKEKLRFPTGQANYGGFSSPPQAAKNVRTNFSIRSQ